MELAKKIFGTRNERLLKSYHGVVVRVNDLEKKYEKLSDDELRNQTVLFRERLKEGEPLNELRNEAFAVVREAAKRSLGMRHFDVQIVGGNVLHEGMIAEMKTGEGKTLVATLPAYLNALTGKGVHVVTVNDYLARRDAEWMGRVYNFLGLSVGVVLSGMSEEQKREAYAADITYGQNNEFGFDYLRDNMKFRAEHLVQRGHNFAIVDEVDSILIDEARTPLIISGPSEESTDFYATADKVIPKLENGTHYEVDLKTKQPTLNEDGIARCEELLEIENLYDPGNIEMLHHVEQALRAHTIMERDVDYVVKNGQVIIVDEFTGRLMAGRRWSNGLHQAVEAKENLKIERENQTLASITFQNLFRMYDKLSGMTGTADTEAVEFKQIYELDVVVVPTNLPNAREDETDKVFRTFPEKYNAVVEDIIEINEAGQPILVGTISIEQSESLSKHLAEAGVSHNVLNAKHHEKEAEIVAQAGRLGAVTIATNMAGRGTDIVLGGNAEGLADAAVGFRDMSNPEWLAALEDAKITTAEEKAKVIEAGGLFILGTERHESRRIDNQLRGRAGRQGDPGHTRFYISLEDDLMVRFGGERIQKVMSRLGWEEGVPIDGRIISKTIESAQKKVEGFHFESRKHVTEYDDVMNKQRQVIYNLRRKILNNEGVHDEILEMIDDLLESVVILECDERAKPVTWDLDAVVERLKFLTNQDYSLPEDIALDQQEIFDHLRTDAKRIYEEHITEQEKVLVGIREKYQDNDQLSFSIPDFNFSTYEQETFLEVLDHLWNEHLLEMDHLREGIGLRGYAQQNPLHEYQKEAFAVFQILIERLKEHIVRRLYYWNAADFENTLLHIEAEQRRRAAMAQQMQASHQAEDEAGEGPMTVDAKDPDAQKEKLKAQRRARRKKKK